jgi:hypothetical protein
MSWQQRQQDGTGGQQLLLLLPRQWLLLLPLPLMVALVQQARQVLQTALAPALLQRLCLRQAAA